MPLFICDRCKCVDNTATSDFWLQAGSVDGACRTGQEQLSRLVDEDHYAALLTGSCEAAGG